MSTLNMKEQDYQLITDFFDRTLDEHRLFLFQKRLAEDPDFERQVELYEYASEKVNELYNSQQVLENQHFREQLDTLREQEKLTTANRLSKRLFMFFKNNKVGVSVAASILVLLLVGVQYSLTPPPIDSIALAERKALEVNVDRIQPHNRSTTELPSFSVQKNIVDAFQKQQYESVLVLSEQISTEQVAALQLIKGIAHRKLNHTEKAAACFSSIQLEQRDIALWNLVALYLESKPRDLNKARYYLKKIIEEDYNSKVDAKKILEQL